MRRIFSIFISCCFCVLVAVAVRAETFQLNDGTTLVGEVASFNDNGLIIRLEDGKFSERAAWNKFSQDDLKKLKENPKIAPFVEPFIEETPQQEPAPPPIVIKPVEHLDRPEKTSLITAMASSSVGLMVLLLVYAANVYAGYEVARYRMRPPGLVCGVSAVLPMIGPIIFLSMPTITKEPEYVAPEVTASQQQSFVVPGSAPAAAEPTSHEGLRLSAAGHAQTGGIPQTQVFARGQFMFNRRFFETKFPGFFGVIRRDADRDMVLVFKTTRGEYIGQRIARISANELHLQVQQDAASQEVMIPFSDVKEIQLKHKNA